MQILITTSTSRPARAIQFTPWTLGLCALALLVPLMLASLLLYHAILIKAAHEQWPVISDVVRFIEGRESAQRERYMRQNIDAMANKVGDLQARLLRMEAVNERVAGLAGLKPDDLKRIEAEPAGGAASAARGGPLVALRDSGVGEVSSFEQLNELVTRLEDLSNRNADVLTLIESRLFEKRLEALMIPSSPPVNGPVGSGFGFRSDPFTGRPALHTGLDFPASIGTPVAAAAGGVVSTVTMHPQYGHMVEVDHGNGLVTRYAHNSAVLVKPTDFVKQGQVIARVGSTGRSTGAHLHFEVLVEGVQQDPAKFLAGKGQAPVSVGVAQAGH